MDDGWIKEHSRERLGDLAVPISLPDKVTSVSVKPKYTSGHPDMMTSPMILLAFETIDMSDQLWILLYVTSHS
jgi:hypothetical protein